MDLYKWQWIVRLLHKTNLGHGQKSLKNPVLDGGVASSDYFFLYFLFLFFMFYFSFLGHKMMTVKLTE